MTARRFVGLNLAGVDLAAATGERKPLPGWRAGVGARVLQVGPLHLKAGACAWGVYFAERITPARVVFGITLVTIEHELAVGWVENSKDGDAELAAEGAALELLRAGRAAWWRRSPPDVIARYAR